MIDSIITLGSAMVGTDFYETGVSLEELGIGHLNQADLLDYLENGNYKEEDECNG